MTRRIPRRLARAPIWLFQRGWGGVFGGRLMMLEHIGRRTGKPRHVVLEVLDHTPGGLLVASGYGPSSQWLANIRAEPRVKIWCGRMRARPGTAEILPPAPARERLESYRQKHRRAAAALGRTLNLPDLTHSGPLPPDVADRLPLVEIRYDQP